MSNPPTYAEGLADEHPDWENMIPIHNDDEGRRCLVCLKPYTPKDPDQKVCGPKCRRKWKHLRKRNKPVYFEGREYRPAKQGKGSDLRKIETELLRRLNALSPHVITRAKSGSIYLGFGDGRIGCLRIANHNGRAHLKYRWSVRTDIDLPATHTSPHNQFWYPDTMIEEICQHIRNYHCSILRNS